jgi:hypothetical protein
LMSVDAKSMSNGTICSRSFSRCITCVREYMSEYVNIHQHTSAYVSKSTICAASGGASPGKASLKRLVYAAFSY